MVVVLDEKPAVVIRDGEDVTVHAAVEPGRILVCELGIEGFQSAFLGIIPVSSMVFLLVVRIAVLSVLSHEQPLLFESVPLVMFRSTMKLRWTRRSIAATALIVFVCISFRNLFTC